MKVLGICLEKPLLELMTLTLFLCFKMFTGCVCFDFPEQLMQRRFPPSRRNGFTASLSCLPLEILQTGRKSQPHRVPPPDNASRTLHTRARLALSPCVPWHCSDQHRLSLRGARALAPPFCFGCARMRSSRLLLFLWDKLVSTACFLPW